MMRFVCLFLCAAACFAQNVAPTAKENSQRAVEVWKELKYKPLRPLELPHVEQFVLSDGMRVLLLENHELPLVRGFGIVRTGNLFDPADKIGLATITGTTIRSGGTKDKTGDQLDQELEDVAASIETSINEDYGSFSFSCLTENLDQVMTLMRDIVTAPEFRQDRIDLAKLQAKSGISRQNDEAGQIANREFRDILYGRNTPFGWMETYATVDHIQRADIQSFYRRYFFPANIILAVQGDFHAPDMKARLENLFGNWKVQQPPVPAFPKAQFDYQPEAWLGVKKDVNQTTFYLGEPGGEARDADYPALEVMSDILGSGFTSRLFRRLRTQLGYVYGVDANWEASYGHPGMFVIAGSTRSDATEPAIQIAREEADKMRAALVKEEELETAKQTVLNSFVFNFDTPSKTINRLLVYKYFNYPDDFIFQFQKAVEKVTREDVFRVAKKYIDPSKFLIVSIGNPKDFGTPLDKLGVPVKPLDLTIPGAPGMPDRAGTPSDQTQ